MKDCGFEPGISIQTVANIVDALKATLIAVKSVKSEVFLKFLRTFCSFKSESAIYGGCLKLIQHLIKELCKS